MTPSLEPGATSTAEPGWRRARLAPSLAEVHRSVDVHGATWFRKLLAFAGPGYLVAVGYIPAIGPPTSLGDRDSATRCCRSFCCQI